MQKFNKSSLQLPKKRSKLAFQEVLNNEYSKKDIKDWPETAVKYFPDRYGKYLYLNNKAEFNSRYSQWLDQNKIIF